MSNAAAATEVDLAHKVLLSGISGAIATTCIYPVDLIKTKLQNQKRAVATTQSHATTATLHTDSSLLHARATLPLSRPLVSPIASATPSPQLLSGFQMIRSVASSGDGLVGFYRGWTPNVLLVMPEKALKLTMNDFFRSTFRKTQPNGQLPLSLELASGGLAGLCQVTATCPMELLKIKGATMSDQVRSGVLKASIPYSQLISTLGISGLYSGVVATLARDVPFSMIYFTLYAQTKAWLLADQHNSGSIGVRSFAAGAIAGTTAAAVTCPFDVVKTRLHASVAPVKLDLVAFVRREFSMIRHHYLDVVRNEGYRALFKGIGPRCLIISPLFAITMFCYEESQAMWLNHVNKKRLV